MSFSLALQEHQTYLSRLPALIPAIEAAGRTLQQTFARGNKLLLCGNGGSAADCQHIAAEFVVRYRKVRPALPAIALTTDTSILTAHPNDFSFDTVFERQVAALGQPGDCLLAISTSGNSPNIIAAVGEAKARHLSTLVLSGHEGGRLAGMADHEIIVPGTVTARIQEMHILIAHWWCEQVEQAL
ncbi:MAG: D-sedoheptulose 7-phosphate isomerase [Thiothrix sp.]|nr:D-sedoheptulose 7-phosphate isomerase [Thiothrix sp.]HPE62142.1 D-sedoheptulose 7-phosphate isomerase [Thiolinea sp.]